MLHSAVSRVAAFSVHNCNSPLILPNVRLLQLLLTCDRVCTLPWSCWSVCWPPHLCCDHARDRKIRILDYTPVSRLQTHIRALHRPLLIWHNLTSISSLASASSVSKLEDLYLSLSLGQSSLALAPKSWPHMMTSQASYLVISLQVKVMKTFVSWCRLSSAISIWKARREIACLTVYLFWCTIGWQSFGFKLKIFDAVLVPARAQHVMFISKKRNGCLCLDFILSTK